MFANTEVDKNHTKDIIKIDKYFLNAKEHSELFSKELGIKQRWLNIDNSWFQLDDGLYFFKKKDIFNELFLSELIKEYKVRCVDFSLAVFKDNIGIISKSFRKKNKKYYEYDDFFNAYDIIAPKKLTILNHMFRQILTDKNRMKIMNDFYRLTVFDWFTGQNDRTSFNMIFEVGDDLKIAPITDNGSSLIYIRDEDKELEKYYRIYMSVFDHLVFPINNKLNKKSIYIINLINNHLEFYKYLCKSLDVDINTILNRVIEKYNLIVSKSDKEQLISYFDKKKNIVERTLSIANKHK